MYPTAGRAGPRDAETLCSRPLEAPIARRSLLDGKRRGRSPFPPPPEPGEPGPAPGADPAPQDAPWSTSDVDAPDELDALDQRPMPAPFRPATVPEAALEDGLRAPTPPPISRTVTPPAVHPPAPPESTPVPWARASTWPPSDEASAPPVPWGTPARADAPASPAPEAPILKALTSRPPSIVRPDAPLTQYVRNQEPSADGATPFLADRPFGEEKFYGSQFTPFFVQDDGPQGAMDDDGTDGIPTGLPPLLDLPELGSIPPAQVVAPPKATLPPLERTWAMPQEVTPPARATPEVQEVRPSYGPVWGAVGFAIGVGVTAAAWLILG